MPNGLTALIISNNCVDNLYNLANAQYPYVGVEFGNIKFLVIELM